jgi:hypothetical protein
MKRYLALLSFLVSFASCTPDAVVILATFDGADKTTFEWQVKNDPVMGGGSQSSFVVTNQTGVFNGTCAIVKFLKAPGFASVHTLGSNTFNNAGSCVEGSMDLMVRSSTPTYKGFKIGWSSPNIPIKPQYGHGGGSFKANFQLKDDTDWQLVQIPMSDFSDDWSPFTGDCDTKDPTGKQHHCCGTGENAQYCPTATFLSTITELAIWAEGVKGDFHIEILYIGASA